MGFIKKQMEKPYFIPLVIVIALGFLLRWTVLAKYGVHLSIHSDDLGYQRSAIQLLKNGMLTYHYADQPTVHIMPGQPFLLAVVFFFFKSGTLGLLVAKMIMITFGLFSIYFTFKIGKYILNPWAGIIGAFLLAIYVPQIVIDNLTLTESPYLCFTLALLYWSLKLADTHSMKDFYLVLLFYFLSLFFRVQNALYPIILFIYLIVKRYPFSIMRKQIMISIIAMLIVLGPWWIRNYIEFHQFIPLTAGSGNPLLLGTYQGEGYPGGKDIDQITNDILKNNPGIEVHKLMDKEKEAAIQRMKTWWNTDKKSMIKSYLILKPKILWQDQFYWIPIFHVTPDLMQTAFVYIKKLFLLSTVLVFLFSFRKWREYIFLWGLILFQTYFNCLYFAFNRYALPLMPILFVIIGIGIVVSLSAVAKLLKKKFPSLLTRQAD